MKGFFQLFKIFILIALTSFGVHGQLVQLGSTESFETDGNGSRYTSGEFDDVDAEDEHFFLRLQDGSTKLYANMSGEDGSFYWVMGKLDVGANPNNPVGIMELDPIDITGFGDLEVRMLLGSTQPDQYENGDYLEVYASIDGGADILIGNFEQNSGNGRLRQDTDLNGDDNGGAPELTATFQSFTFPVPGTGSSMVIKIFGTNDSGSGREQTTFDNIQVFGQQVLSAGALATPASVSSLETAYISPSAPQVASQVVFDFNITVAPGDTRVQFDAIDFNLADVGIDWANVIADAQLYSERISDNAQQFTITSTGFSDANNTVLEFTGINDGNNQIGDINQGEAKLYQLRLRLSTNIPLPEREAIDGANINISLSGSDFNVTSGNIYGSNTITSGDVPIEVIATEYAITAQPTLVSLNTDFGLTVQAQDPNGNLDLDNTDAVTLARGTGTGTLSSVLDADLTSSLSTGEFSWTDLQFDTNEIFDIDATGAETTGTSASIDVAPSIASVVAPANDTYAFGENVDFTVTFDESVTITGTPRIAITLANGGPEFATFEPGTSPGTAHVFRYTVDNNDLDLDGLAIVSPLQLNSGTINDAGGNPTALSFTSPNTTGVLVDGTGPTVSSVTIPSNTYAQGDNIDISVQFDEIVNVTNTPRIQFTMETGGTVNADYQSGSGSNTLVFRYQVQNGDNDANGITLISPIQENGGTLEDVHGNSATLTYTLPNTTGVLVDAQDPTITNFDLPSNVTYGSGQNLDFDVTYDEVVQVTGTPRIELTLNTGGTVYANYFDGDNSNTLTFRYTIVNGNEDLDGIGVASVIDLNSGSILDNVGRTADLNYSVGSTAGILIDAIQPMITSVTPPTDDTYIISQNVDFTINFNKNITVTNTPRIAITLASGTVFANYQSGSGSSNLVFRYNVSASDLDTDGVLLNSPIQLNGGTLQDGLGNDAILTFTLPVTTAILVDGVAPTITSVTPPGPGTYAIGDNLDFIVNYDDVVNATPTPRIQLNLNSGTVFANYFTGSGTTEITYRYTVNSDDFDNNGITMVSPIQENTGSLQDVSGNTADLTYALPVTTGILIDGQAPRISTVTRATPSTSPTNANTIEWDVEFNEAVLNVGTDDFTVTGAGNIQTVAHQGGNVYRVTVSGGGLTNYNGTVTLGINGATDITDVNLNLFTNFTPTGTNNNTFVMDNTPPVPPSVPNLAAGSDSFGGEANSNGSNSDNVTNDTTPTFTGTAEAGSTVEIRSNLLGIIGSGTATGGTYSITTSALFDATHTITARATDPLGNVGLYSSGLAVTIDTQAPIIQGNLIFADNGGNRETVTFTFNETIDLNNNTEPLGFTSSTNSVRNTSVYQTTGNQVVLESNNNGGWTIATTFNYANGAGNIRDLAGNELATQSGLTTADNTPPTLITGIQYLPNGNGPEQIVFNLSEEIDIAEGGFANGFLVNGQLIDNLGFFGTAIYSSKANENTITITSLSNNTWTDAVTISYQQGANYILGGPIAIPPFDTPIPSNVFDISSNELGNFNQTVQLKGVTLVSNNPNPSLAKTGEIITLSFTANGPLDADPVITILGNAPTTFDNSLAPSYTATYTLVGSEAEGLVPISITTLQGGLTTVVTNTTNHPTTPSSVTYDRTPPQLDPITIVSNNSFNTAMAKVGDVVSLSISINPNESLASGQATLAGEVNPSASGGPYDFTFTHTMDGSEPEGLVTFSVLVGDAAGNTETFTTTTDASQVVFDKTIPDINFITRTDGNPEDAGINNGEVRFNVQFSETVNNVDVTDFAISSSNLIGTPTVTNVNANTGTDFEVTVSGFDLANSAASGTVNLNLAVGYSIIDNAANNVSGTILGADETYTVINPEPAEDIATLNANPNTTSVNLSWTNSSTDQIAYQHLILVRESGTLPNPADNSFIANDTDLTTGITGQMFFNVAHGLSSFNVIGLNSATSYDFEIYPYTNDGTNVNYKTNAPASTTVSTTTASETTIAFNSASTTISSLSTTPGSAITVFSFVIDDDGLANGADNADTRFNQLRITQGANNDGLFVDWTSVIAGFTITDGTTNISHTDPDVDFQPGYIEFTNLSNASVADFGFIADNTSKTYTLAVYLQAGLPADADNKVLDFEFDASNPANITLETNSSGISPANFSASTGAANNIIDVAATRYVITSNPNSIEGKNVPLANAFIVEARDINNNIDWDIDEFISPTTFQLSVPGDGDALNDPDFSCTTCEFVDGVSVFADFNYASTGDGTITINDLGGRGISSATTTPVDIIDTEVSEITDGVTSNGSSLNTGLENVVLLGFQLNATSNTPGQPILNQITFSFENQNGDPFDIGLIYESFRVFRSNNNAFNLSDPLSDDVLINGLTVTEGLTSVTISGLAEVLDTDVTNQNFALVANVALTAQFAVTPSPIIRAFYSGGDFMNSNGSVSLQGGASEFYGLYHTYEDNQFPLIKSLNPIDGEPLTPNNNVNIATNLVIEFNEPMNPTGSETITLRKQLDNGFVLNLTSPTVSPDGTTFTFNPAADLDENTNYYVQINSEVFFDKAGNAFVGISNSTDWNFKTSDATAPEFVNPDPIVAINRHNDGFDLGVRINEEGEVFYLVIPTGQAAPTRNEIFSASYGGTISASGSIEIVSANQYHYDIITGLSGNDDYEIWAAAVDNADPPNNDGAIVSLAVTGLNGSQTTTQVNNPEIEICEGDYQRVLQPITIREGQNSDFTNGNNQSILLALPANFELNTSSANTVIEIAGSNISNATLTFVNATIFRINYDISGTSGSLDYIIIKNLEVKATSATAAGEIVRIGGTANQDGNTESDGLAHATLSVSGSSAANFTFQLDGTAISTVANDEISLDLVPEPALQIEGLNVFSGDGVVGNKFFIGSVPVGDHDVSLTHTTLQGCQLSGVETISIFDATSAVPGLDVKYCLGAGQIVTITEDGKQAQGFRLISFVADGVESTANISAVEPAGGGDYTIDIDLAGSPLGAGEGTVILKVTATYQSLTNTAIEESFPLEIEISSPPAINTFTVASGPKNPTDFCVDGVEINFSGDYNEAVQNNANHNFRFLNLPDSISDIIDFSITTTNPSARILPQDLVDEVGYGDYAIEWIITNPNTTCSNSQSLNFSVNPKPVADFVVQDENGITNPLGIVGCVFEEVNQTSTYFSSTSTVIGGIIDKWDWNFDDPDTPLANNPDEADTETVNHKYAEDGTYSVELTVESNVGCRSDQVEKTLTIGNNPTPQFTYQNIGLGEATQFSINSSVLGLSGTEVVSSVEWSFNERDGNGQTAPNPAKGTFNGQFAYVYPFNSIGTKDIQLTLTSNLSCSTTILDSLFVVPMETLVDGENYTAFFEDDNDEGWQTWGTNNSWVRGTSGGDIINSASPTNGGSSFWVTGNGTYDQSQESYVYSPIFDMSELDRPLVTMDIFDNINQNDGAVLEYSLIGFGTTLAAEDEWKVVGGLETGINWYDQRDITNAAGLDNPTNLGWSDEEEDWKNARNTLTPVAGQPRVQFRVSFKSGPNENVHQSDGFAFDNFFIGQRTRTVLVENFTNMNGTQASIIDQENTLNLLAGGPASGTELIVINYHTDFPSTNSINSSNPVDPSARALFYDIRNVPSAVIDGNITDEQNRLFSVWGEDSFELRTLALANFGIDINTSTSDGKLNINVDVTPKILPLTGDHITVTAAVLENPVSTSSGSFGHVLRKLLPNAAGYQFATSTLQKDIPFNLDFEWTPMNITDPDNLFVVVFIQDEETKEIYQAEIDNNVPTPDAVTAVEEARVNTFSFYPNPANDQVTILFNQSLHNGTLKIYDNFGKLVFDKAIEETSLNLSTQDFASGMYHIQVSNDDTVMRKRLIITHNDR
ncbi:Ig-like domain-containing protein [Fulvivirga sp.]|uniref:Ig-like domain-containing protein n=1 Tax=Fulvivirga sp. TaxID=1931237 RepID=UPI0032F038A7